MTDARPRSGIGSSNLRNEHSSLVQSDAWAIQGRVLDVSNRPIANALVCNTDSAQGCCAPERCTRSDSEGRFSFSGQRQPPSYLSTTATGYAGHFGPIVTGGAQSTERGVNLDLTITLNAAPQQHVSGQVVDASGGPVPAAVVTAFQDGESSVPLGITQSSPTGDYDLALPPGSVRLVARAVAYSEVARTVTSPADHVVLVLAPGSVLSGRVLARDDGMPIADALVNASQDNGFDIPRRSVRTGPNGEFRIESLPASNYQLSAVHERWQGSDLWVSLGVGERREDLVLEVVRGGMLRARVSVAGQPCRKGEILLEGTESSVGVTDEQGSLEMLGLVPGTYRARVWCDGAMPLIEEGLAVGTETVSRTWNLDSGLVLNGRALRANGAPLPNASISIVAVGEETTHEPHSTARQGEPPRLNMQQCSSDDTGTFSCSGLAPGTYDCKLMGPRGPRGDAVRVALQPGISPVITLKASGEGTLRVVWDEDTAPPRSAPILADSLDHSETWVASRLAGSAVFDALPLGRYAVHLGVKDEGQAPRVKLAKDGETIEVRLPPTSGLRISGRLVDSRGEGIPDAWVTATPSFDALGSFMETAEPVLSDPSGRFDIGPLSSGGYRIEASTPNGRGTLEGVNAGASDIVLQIASYSGVAGRVLGPGGNPVPRFTVDYANSRGEASRLSAGDGAFRLRRLLPDRYHLQFETPEGWTGSAEVEVTPNREAPLSVTLQQTSEQRPVASDPGRLADPESLVP